MSASHCKNGDQMSLVELVGGLLVLFCDMVLAMVFFSRVRVSFDAKYSLDDQWQAANDRWLKSSRISGLVFTLSHIGVLCLVLVNGRDECLRGAYTYPYWICQSVWMLFANFALVLITQRV